MTAPALSNRLTRLVTTVPATSFAPTLAHTVAHTVAHITTRSATIAVGVLLAGCSSLGLGNLGTSSVVTALSPYRMEVVQGNFVSKEQAEALKPGMPRAQVRDILGTPLLTSVFHGDRWDYVFTIRRQGITAQARRFTVFFKGDTLERFEGDELPSETEFVGQLESSKKLGKAPLLDAPADALKKFAPTTPPITSPVTPAVAASTKDTITTAYPPLEGPAQ